MQKSIVPCASCQDITHDLICFDRTLISEIKCIYNNNNIIKALIQSIIKQYKDSQYEVYRDSIKVYIDSEEAISPIEW